MSEADVGPREVWELPARRLGRRVLVYERLDSTSTVAARLAEGPDADGLAVLADEQTAGRGQHGRSWTCPPRSGVLLSVVLFPPAELRRPVVLTAWAAVAVCLAIRDTTGLAAGIKWPNDVLLEGKKVCGILIEQGRGTVAGIGLNVSQPAWTFAEAGLPEATSLAAASGRVLERDEVARRLLMRLDELYDRLCAGERFPVEAAWREGLNLLGRRVQAEGHDRTREGRLVGLSWDEVTLEEDSGAWVALAPESLRHLRAV